MGIVKADAISPELEIVKEFTDEERERMAEREHARWNVERLSGGQKHGKEKKDEKSHPELVAWSDLSAAEKQKDRDYVDQIFRVETFGYCVVRGRNP